MADLEGGEREKLAAILTFEELPPRTEIVRRAQALAALAVAHGAKEALIGGAPYLMGPLEVALCAVGVVPLYAFSVRESVEQVQADGSVRKVQVFRHLGFVEGTV
ncbi:MAG: hypothetical protein M0Z27_10560 [Thermaerobacter sp.]|nr:hypothetical protein [Thermaerobacter sp.]